MKTMKEILSSKNKRPPMKELKIQKGWYRSAGYKYGWANAGYIPEGVGINRDILYSTDELLVEVNDEKYKVNTKEAINFIKKYGSHYPTPGGTKIGVISRSLMKKADD